MGLTGHLLVATQQQCDPDLSGAVIYICRHDDSSGAFGIVINKPTRITVNDLLVQVGLDPVGSSQGSAWVYSGGPLSIERGFVLHTTDASACFGSSLLIRESQLTLTSSTDVLEAMSKGTGPARSLVALGHCAWSTLQLEDEIKNNYWLTVSCDIRLLFESNPAVRLSSALASLGIQPGALVPYFGRA